MQHYFDVDASNGFMGYDYVINRRVGERTTSIEHAIGNGYAWSGEDVGSFRMAGNELMIRVPIAAIGGRVPDHADFKWADHCGARQHWTDLTLNGEAAPNDRFSYRATFAQHTTRP